jgi:hypothetical protein
MKIIEVVWDQRTRQLWVNEADETGHTRVLIHAYGVDAFHFRGGPPVVVDMEADYEQDV